MFRLEIYLEKAEYVERFKSERPYPRFFAMIIAMITSLILVYTIINMIGEISTIFPIAKSGYIYLLEKVCIISSLALLSIYLLRYYGREKSNLYMISLVLLIVYLLVPIIDELMNTSMDVLPSKLSLAKMFFRIIMIIAVFLLLLENREKKDRKAQIIIFGTIFVTMFIGMVLSTSAWITGGYDEKIYFWRTAGEVFIENINFLPYIFCAYFCSKNHSVLANAKGKNIDITKPLLKRIQDK